MEVESSIEESPEPVTDLEKFVAEFLDDQVGLDAANWHVYEHHGIQTIRLVSRCKSNKPKSNKLSIQYDKNEWRDTGLELIDKLDRGGFGQYELDTLSENHVSLEETK